MPLTQADTKHWAPIPAVTEWLTRSIPPDARVLEVGPGHCPFPRADVCVDIVDVPGVPADKLIKLDRIEDPLPFPDKSFDFVYCRHTLEDMHDPFRLCREMSRVGKAGYIETPSPLAELCRGIDGGSPPWRGYHHHRWIVWTAGDELRFVTKYPLVEHIVIYDTAVDEILKEGPLLWNTYFVWSGEIKTRHLQNPTDFVMNENYRTVLGRAVFASAVAGDRFLQTVQS